MDRLFANPAYGWVRSLAAAITGGLGFYGAAKDRRVAGLPYDAWLLLCIAYTVSIVLHFQARTLSGYASEVLKAFWVRKTPFCCGAGMRPSRVTSCPRTLPSRL